MEHCAFAAVHSFCNVVPTWHGDVDEGVQRDAVVEAPAVAVAIYDRGEWQMSNADCLETEG